MARKEKIYKRVPGRPFSPFGVNTLWYGPDHLLMVESVFFKERYKRFYFKDIQSIALHRTATHWVWACLWSAFALLFGVIAYLVPGTPYVSGTIFGFSIVALGMNLFMGPGCQVFLQTAVQRQRIFTLKRVRTAVKAMDRIKTFVEEQQGGWEKQKSIDAHKKQMSVAPSGPDTTPVTTVLEIKEKAPAGPYRPLLHKILFGLLAVLGGVGVVQIVLKNLPLGLLEALLHGVVQIMVIVTLVRWYRHLKGTAIAKMNWLVLILIAFYTVVGYILYFAVSFRYPEINYNNWAIFKRMFELQMTDHPLALAFNVIYAGGSLLLGVFGMLMLRRHTQRLKP